MRSHAVYHPFLHQRAVFLFIIILPVNNLEFQKSHTPHSLADSQATLELSTCTTVASGFGFACNTQYYYTIDYRSHQNQYCTCTASPPPPPRAIVAPSPSCRGGYKLKAGTASWKFLLPHLTTFMQIGLAWNQREGGFSGCKQEMQAELNLVHFNLGELS